MFKKDKKSKWLKPRKKSHKKRNIIGATVVGTLALLGLAAGAKKDGQQ